MTQIKLRRDTSANFASKNPVLGIGEPAYETDTKKLKIGDGTTAYNSLDYFSTGGGGGGTTDITASLPLVLKDGVLSLQIDGQTLQVNTEGKLAANLDELGNEVNDLSGRVTTVEADVLQKQNVIVANTPLQLTESSSIELQSDKLSYDDTTGILSYASGTQVDVAACIDLSRLHLKTHEPYTLHLRVARNQTSATGNSNFFRLRCYNDGTDTTFRGVRVWNGSGTGRAGGTNTIAKALILNSTDYVHYEFRYDGTNGISEYRGRNNNESDATTLTINTFTDQAGDYSKFENEFTQLFLNCYYGYAGKFDLSQSYIQQGNIKYILKDVVAGGTSTLQLNIGDGLSVTDGKLIATSTTPTNMVTTDTQQTISAAKTFSKNVNIRGVLNLTGGAAINTTAITLGNYIKVITGSGLTREADGYKIAIAQSTSTIFGDVNMKTKIRGSSVVNNNDKKFITEADVATSSAAGIVKPDGTSITVSDDGTISASASGGGDVTAAGDNTFTGTNTFDKIVLPNDTFTKGIFIKGQTNPSIYAYGDSLNLSKISTLRCTSFYTGATGQAGTIEMGDYPKSGNSDIKFTGYNNDSTVAYTGLRYSADLKRFELGDTRIPIMINGSTVTDSSLKKFLTQGNVTAGDNVTITDTTNGIQISATGGSSSTPPRYPVEVSDKSLMPSWYVVYNDGWCEQGGIMTGSGAGSRVTLTFLKPYINAWFYFNSKTLSTYTGTWTGNFETVTNVTSSSINVWGGASGEHTYWYSSGYIS